jgi:GT2 family glycosyltransferase
VSALFDSRDVSVDVVVVDNGCSDDAVASLAPRDGLRVVSAGANLGFGGGCNLGAEYATGEVVAFVNPDAVVSPTALAALAGVVAEPRVGMASARVRLLADPDLLNSCGGAMHFLGLGWAEGYLQPVTSATERRSVMGASGAAMAMPVGLFRRLGGFTSRLFLYQEDLELSLRVRMVGLSVEFVPDADVWHDYDFARNPGKYYYLERNRLILVCCVYQSRTLVMIAPALLLIEVGMVLMAAAQGWLPQKVRGWRWLVRNRGWVVEHRRHLQRVRSADDRSLAPLIAGRFDAGQVPMPPAVRPVDRCLGVYWRVVRSRL